MAGNTKCADRFFPRCRAEGILRGEDPGVNPPAAAVVGAGQKIVLDPPGGEIEVTVLKLDIFRLVHFNCHALILICHSRSLLSLMFFKSFYFGNGMTTCIRTRAGY